MTALARVDMVEVDTLARTIWGEARGEGRIGMECVAEVVRNRVLDRRWPDTYTGVCRQRLQFSCWNQTDPNRPRLLKVTMADRTFRTACDIAASTIAGQIPPRLNGANHYLTCALFDCAARPRWARLDAPQVRIGRHVFLTL